MSLTRREFLVGSAALTAFWDGLAAASPDARTFEGPTGRAADFLICRRLHLDICGRLPTRMEAERFVASRDADKVERLVDELLASESYADYWSMRYCDMLRVKSEFPINLWPNAVYVYHRRIRAAIADDEPWDAFARALLGGRGSNFRVPESNFLRAVQTRTPEGVSEAASATFLLKPTAEYARFFSRVAWKKTREWKEEITYLEDGPEDATPEAFMELLEGKLKERFHAAPVVRVHWWTFGRRPTRDCLDEWTEAFEDGGLRLKPLLRHVFTSPRYLAGPVRGGFPARRMDAEVLEDALCDLTGAEHDFRSIAPEPFTFLPKRRRAVLIEDGSITSPFLLLFGRPSRDSGDLAERSNAITAKQRLQLFNSAKLWRDLGQFGQDPRFRGLNRREKIEDLYLRFLARPPTPAEMRLLNGKNELGPREIAWMLVNSREFLYRI